MIKNSLLMVGYVFILEEYYRFRLLMNWRIGDEKKTNLERFLRRMGLEMMNSSGCSVLKC